jgi:hypothetical protein
MTTFQAFGTRANEGFKNKKMNIRIYRKSILIKGDSQITTA